MSPAGRAHAWRAGAAALAGLAAVAAFALATPPAARAQGGLPTIPATIGGQPFLLEVAADPQTMYRGLGGRRVIPPLGGMLFVYPAPGPLAFVMRDCPIPIDVAFLDPDGRIVGIHTMKPEPPRRPDESAAAYESRLPSYPSPVPAQYAVELAGGRLAELGVRAGDRVTIDFAKLPGPAR
jgi:uncharacterized membrane protein (UPF0127 family)